ncbi:hypothetical protein ES692_17645 [Psychroserpens burtonensis]|uniref:DUF6933 domain-containing protein n=1 Tax=Psychroserpens burtonensis TaxID=49278 RepID=A0A5C7B2G1_9FLAO|nr:hypothetical protein [Psychroserpens burtonensis]TXE14911.1 hypothetical protein ES692_17645 [Psychroserpens burtonensis]
MQTKIHTSKKLEKLVKKLIRNDQNDEDGILGKWNATVFYVERKKCWLISNARSQYNVILSDIKKLDLDKIEEIFKNTLYAQLVYDGIIMDFNHLSTIIGGLNFQPTDNDRKTMGFQNHRLQDLNYWKHEFGSLDNMPIKDLTNRINTSPIHIGEGQKMSDYTDPIEEIKKLLKE